MTRYYCDICGFETNPEYIGGFAEEFNVEHLCPTCLDIARSLDTSAILKQALKDAYTMIKDET